MIPAATIKATLAKLHEEEAKWNADRRLINRYKKEIRAAKRALGEDLLQDIVKDARKK